MDTPKKRILVVEDDPSVALALKDMLANEGFEMTSAAGGEEGLATAIKDHPDLIVTDLKMPGMNGIDMLHELRKDSWGKTANVLVLSNASDLDSLQSAMTEGAFHYMVKGDTGIAEIIDTVKKQLA